MWARTWRWIQSYHGANQLQWKQPALDWFTWKLAQCWADSKWRTSSANCGWLMIQTHDPSYLEGWNRRMANSRSPGLHREFQTCLVNLDLVAKISKKKRQKQKHQFVRKEAWNFSSMTALAQQLQGLGVLTSSSAKQKPSALKLYRVLFMWDCKYLFLKLNWLELKIQSYLQKIKSSTTRKNFKVRNEVVNKGRKIGKDFHSSCHNCSGGRGGGGGGSRPIISFCR